MKQQVNFLKKTFLFITISSLLTINDSMGTVIRQILESESSLSIGKGLDNEANPFLTNSALRLAADNITKIDATATAIQAIDINGKSTNLPPSPILLTNLQFIGDCSVGSVVNLINQNQIIVSIGQSKVENPPQDNIESNLTLTGTNIPEFQGKLNDYSGISKIVFASRDSTLNIESADNQPIYFDRKLACGESSLGSTLNVISNFFIRDLNGAYIPKINIGSTSNGNTTKPAILRISCGIKDIKELEVVDFHFLVNGGGINFVDKDSKLQFQNDKGDKRTVYLHDDLASEDNKGIVEFDSIGSESTIIISDSAVPGGFPRRGTIGKSEEVTKADGSKEIIITRIKEVCTTGEGHNIFNIPIFAGSVEAYSRNTVTSELIFNKEVTADINFHDASKMVAKANIIGNIDYRNLNANVTIEDNKTIKGNVISTGGKNGELNFPVGGEVTGNIGDEKNGIKEVNLAKGTLKLGNARADINFNGDSTLLANGNITGILDFKNSHSKIILAKDKKITGEVVSSGGTNGEINFEDSGEVAGDIGASDKEIMNVNIKHGTVKLADVNAKNIKLDEGTGDERTVEFAGSNLRTIDVPLVTVDKDPLKRSIEQFHYKTRVNVDQFNMPVNVLAKFNNAAFIEKQVQGGILEFNDDVWLNNGIVKAKKVTFGANKSAFLVKNIEANNIIADQAKIVILEDMSITGDLAANNMALDLSNKILTVTDTKKFSGTLEIDSSYDSSKLEGGYINIIDGAKIQFSEVEKMIINVTIKSNIDQIPIGTKYALVRVGNNGRIEGPPKSVVLNVKDQNRFTEWEIDKEGKNLFLYSKLEEEVTTDPVVVKPDPHEDATGTVPTVPTEHTDPVVIPEPPVEVPTDPTDPVVVKPDPHEDATVTVPTVPTEHVNSSIIGLGGSDRGESCHNNGSCDTRVTQNLSATSEQQKFAQQLGNVVDHNSDAAKVKHMLCDMAKGHQGAESREVVNRLTSRTPPSSTVMNFLVLAATQEIHNRISELGKLLRTQNPIIQAAGDEVRLRSGVWISPFYSQASQKMKNDISGYKLKASGGMFGIDYQINDNLLIGGAYSRSQVVVSHKDIKKGDKTKARVNIFLLYGLQHLTDKWYLEGIISYASSKVKNNEGRRALNNLERAIGRYNAISYGGQLVAGYNYPIGNTDITPLIGLRYTKFHEGNYQEAGTACQNLTVKKRVYNKTEALVGMRVSTTIIEQ
ncbi:autotransporter outer membrane beta-barrel domain-containing protein [Candidatus Tisiphia endosymbiont of Beris chalybata]|uniref:autotransporter outer membrane beta-barrel domain-containing protein n=1 Tax=Candidatus Tisiphia endosymbiont of Beris chalybata TaxID=3066262 RepID=UPI00312C9D20